MHRYLLYAVFVLTLLPKDKEGKQNQAKNSSFPDNWAHSGIGKAGLGLAGIAFVAGASPVLTCAHSQCQDGMMQPQPPACHDRALLPALPCP